MATGSYSKVASAETTVADKTAYNWRFIGSNETTINTDVRNKIPKFATINSATVSLQVKRDGTSDLNMYNHDAAWQILNSSGNVQTTLWSQDHAIKRSYTTFSRDVLSYINSDDANAGVASSIYSLRFRASGDLAKDYTYKNVRIDIGFTYPTITIVGKVNNESYGKITTDGSVTLGSKIDIGARTQEGKRYCDIYAIPNDGYKFVAWSDGVTTRDRRIELSEDVLTAHDTTLTYTAIFEKEETSNVFDGTQKMSAYCGTKKVSIYCGTKLI